MTLDTNDLVPGFVEDCREHLDHIEASLMDIEAAGDNQDPEVVNSVFRAAHSIKGGAGMLGFDAIKTLSHKLESVLHMVRSQEMKPTKGVVSVLLEGFDKLSEMVNDITQSEDISIGAQVAKLVALAEQENVGASAPVEPVKIDVGPSRIFSVDSLSLEQAKAGGNEIYLLEYDLIHDIHGQEKMPMEVLRSLTDTGRIVDCKVDFSAVGDLDAFGNYIPFYVLFATILEPKYVCGLVKLPQERVRHIDDAGDAVYIAPLKAEPESGQQSATATAEMEQCVPVEMVTGPTPILRDVQEPKPKAARGPAPLPELPTTLGDLPTTGAPKLGEILVQEGVLNTEDLQKALGQQKPLGKILTESGLVSEEQVEQAIARQQQTREASAARQQKDAGTSLRVAADKLDLLVDLVGELVIVQAQISQVVTERSDPILTVLSEQLERLSSDLRDSTLGIRMLPIGTAFSKFRRLVRDLSSELGKEIELVTRGEETELDKTVLERLGDPLVHLIRNSIDHGIDMPEERKRVGKRPEGTILLEAEHSGSEVLIRITDDGKGMDAEVIRKKAVEKGLIAAEAELTEQETLKLIFLPGFSTAAKVTNISGRGVGMDVVHRAIDSLRGVIEIKSAPGQGTTITIRLPLTLAIIEGLQVEVAEAFFVIPLSLVEECVELHSKDIDPMRKQQIIHLRGELVPYIHLRRWFEMEGLAPDIEQIVITGVEGKRIGIVVDRVVGEHQTVIKSLGRVYRDVEGISGATIKGDGTLALILDVPRLVRSVVSEISN